MSGRVVRLNEDEDIYIDCNPVTTEGEEITDDNNEIKPELVNNQILDELTNNIVGGELFNNIGIQTIIGVVVFAVLYGLGNYVFKDVPKNIIQKKLPQEMQ